MAPKLKFRSGASFTNIPGRTVSHSSFPDRHTGNPHPEYLGTGIGTSNTNDGVGYVAKSGHQYMTGGTLEVRETGGNCEGIRLYKPGAPIEIGSQVELLSRHNGAYELYVGNPTSSFNPAKVRTAYPTHESHLSTAQYARDVWAPSFSGPHVWEDRHYEQPAAMPSWSLHSNLRLRNVGIGVPGVWKFYGTATGHITEDDTVVTSNIYLAMWGMWADGGGVTYKNGDNNNFFDRLSSYSNKAAGTGMGRTYRTMYAEGWADNRTDMAWVDIALKAQCDGNHAACSWGGQYRVGAEFWPYGGADPGLSIGWHSW